MKQNRLYAFLGFLFLCHSNVVSAYDFKENGIFYNITSAKDMAVEVTREGDSNSEYYLSGGYHGHVTIPSKVTHNGQTFDVSSIGNYAFTYASGRCSYNDNIYSVTIPNSVVQIGNGAFAGCEGITSIDIPNSVTRIGNWCFHHCSALSSIKLPSKLEFIDSKCFEDCISLKSIELPEGICRIDDYAFRNCSSLESIVIPRSVRCFGLYEDFGYEVFAGCTNLLDVTALMEVPFRFGRSCFPGNTYLNGILHVPENTKELYESTDSWNEFLNIEDKTVPNNKYLITITCNGKGKVVYSNTEISNGTESFIIEKGNDASFTFIAYNGFILNEVKLNGEDITSKVVDGHYVIWNVNSNANLDVTFREIPVFLKIKQANNGNVEVGIPRGNKYICKINSESDWRIHSVTFNDEDVTSQLSNGNIFTTPVIEGNSTMIVVYERIAGQTTAINGSNESIVNIQGTSFGVRIANVEPDEPIRIYSQDGKLLQSVKSAGNQMDIPLPRNNVYVIKVCEKVMKVRI